MINGADEQIRFSDIGIAALALRAACGGLSRKHGAGKQSTGLFSFPPFESASFTNPNTSAHPLGWALVFGADEQIRTAYPAHSSAQSQRVAPEGASFCSLPHWAFASLTRPLGALGSAPITDWSFVK